MGLKGARSNHVNAHMDLSEAVSYIAQAEGRRVRPITDEAELDELDADVGHAVPVLDVKRDALTGRLRVTGRLRAERHDNAPRLPMMAAWLEGAVLPMLGVGEGESDLVGAWRIELHDSYSYLNGRAGYREALSFGRAPESEQRRVALMPDPYHVGNFGGLLQRACRGLVVPWEKREPTLFFAGTTTGDRNPARNERIRACVWSLGRRDISRMHITNIAQMTYQAACAAWPTLPEVMHRPFEVEEHFSWRYQVNIAGNTACWSRLPMVMASGSLLVHARGGDSMWYYPLIREREHYVASDSADGHALAAAHSWCRANDADCQRIASMAARLAGDLFEPAVAASYAAQLLLEAGSSGHA